MNWLVLNMDGWILLKLRMEFAYSFERGKNNRHSK
jgi:hypothetical protein